MPGASGVSTSSSRCGFESQNRPRPWPRTRVHLLVVYSPRPYLRKTAFSARAAAGGCRGAGPHGRDAGGERFTEDIEGTALRVGCLADDQRAANLGEIPCDRGRELRRHQIAGSDAAFRRRRHAEYVLPAGADDHEIIRTPAAAPIGLDVCHHLVLPAAGLYAAR